jgi:excisionase family DNA binding protein
MTDLAGLSASELRPLLVNPLQAAAMLGVSRTTIYYLTRDGELTPVRIGRATRYAVSDLEAYVNRSVAGNQDA